MSVRSIAWTVCLGIAVLSAPATVVAQEKPGVVEEDLGDGFRAVSVNGGPPAIIDTRSGLILKMVYGRPAVVDKASGAMLFEGDDGQPVVKYWKKGGGKDPDGARVKPNLKRMKAFMKRVKAHTKALDRLKKTRKKGKKALPKRKSRIELLLELLGVKGEEAKVFTPLLEAILKKQNEIRASTVDVARLAKGKQTGKGKPRVTLPSAIQDFQRTFSALRAGKAVDDATLQKQLAAFRVARKTQDNELAGLRTKLRELLTVAQEAKLTAVGVLS